MFACFILLTFSLGGGGDRTNYEESFSYIYLDNQASGVGDPLGVAGNAGESSGETLSASGASTEADNADLVVNTSVDEAQWAARVTLNINQINFKS